MKDLCSLASLRDTNSERRRFLRHAIGDALDPVLDQVVAEIDQETESFLHQPQIGQHLFAVHWIECRDRFHFHDHAIVNEQVGAKAFIKTDPVPCDWNRHLSFDCVAVFAQFMREQDFVNDFENTWAEPGVKPVSSVNNHSRNFIFFHAAEPALPERSCEAKNLSAFASLRDTPASFSR
jgi:hypothetical protein